MLSVVGIFARLSLKVYIDVKEKKTIRLIRFIRRSMDYVESLLKSFIHLVSHSEENNYIRIFSLFFKTLFRTVS